MSELCAVQAQQSNGQFVPAQVFREEALREDSGGERARFRDLAQTSDVFVGSAVKDPTTAEWISTVVEEAGIQTRFAADCSPELGQTSVLGKFRPEPAAPMLVRMLPDFLRDVIGGATSGTTKDRQLWDTLMGFYGRNSSEDLTFLSLVLVDT